VLPGPDGSSFAVRDFTSFVVVARAKKEIARSFAGMLVTDREGGANGHNRVFGPDFGWRAGEHDDIRGQWLVSDTRTPNRSDLATEWTGDAFTSQAAQLQW